MLKVVIVGGVAAGMSCAAKLKRNMGDDVDIVVYEKSDTVSYAACGIPFYVSDRIKDISSLVERTPEKFAESGISVMTRHEVTAIDTAAKTVSGRNLETGEAFSRSYDKLVVASGAKVRRIPPLDIERDNLFVVRDLADADAIKRYVTREDVRKVIVVGAGFIGLEIAEACAKQGREVLLVEFADRILATMDPEFTDRLAKELAENGVALRAESKVVALRCDGGRILSATIECKDGREEVDADMVINSAGIVPNAGFIDVDKAVNGAILVNERMETSAPDVYAAGDCAVMRSFVTGEPQYAPLGTNANKQGRMIAELFAGKRVPRLKLLGSSCLRLFDLDVAKVGLSEIDAQRMNIDYKVNFVTANNYASYYGPGKVSVKLVYDARTRRILGAQTMGHGVVAARANYFAIAITAGMTVDEFAFVDMAYSPPFSGVWDATQVAANTAK